MSIVDIVQDRMDSSFAALRQETARAFAESLFLSPEELKRREVEVLAALVPELPGAEWTFYDCYPGLPT